MVNYQKPETAIWTGRKSGQQLYLHEKVQCIDLNESSLDSNAKSFALLGYACNEGVKRNLGRIGAFDGPDVIRTQLGKMPNHLGSETKLLDIGSVQCLQEDMEAAQEDLSEKVKLILQSKALPVLLGGGHDMAYAHYNGIKKYLGKNTPIGIINFDAHFDLRSTENGNNSGTPFYQIAEDCKKDNAPFHYLCLGIRKDANDKVLFQTARDLGVSYIENIVFSMNEFKKVTRTLLDFIKKVDHIYVTIDLDGFSSAYAPGVSAPSPMGFTPKMVLETLKLIIGSNKMISIDIAEMNPKYDIDNHTAKLAASLIHFVLDAKNYSNQLW
ncbi:formiminoglutamase [Zobellia uliginosa]|uniref:Formimidoylglutamase n=1 Tax=Zobellia uliginosa TaxID=143224 RepID=A0ABY1KUN2_9FLAO|nr:formimidoylglutamase [Zobellia uliginosa]SIS81161.1 formiminoglutamase [Zobellia uliginosa]